MHRASLIYALIYLFARCYARLHPRAVNCRKKKCGHSNQVCMSCICFLLGCIIFWISFCCKFIMNWIVLSLVAVEAQEEDQVNYDWGYLVCFKRVWISDLENFRFSSLLFYFVQIWHLDLAIDEKVEYFMHFPLCGYIWIALISTECWYACFQFVPSPFRLG